MSVGKKQLADSIVDNYGLSKGDALKVVDHIFSEIAATLSFGTDVEIHGFGKFVVIDRAERVARNPRTGETVKVPPMRVLKFKPAKGLKTSLNSDNTEPVYDKEGELVREGQ